ncbi:ABC transporter permease [Alloacidobacterium dinghuense]|uniref:ABC transporter permease n=1 Tax=Alloacidobacterium dinghuense TaxID=2763107 RepID=A0A7G8BFA3_9BACT|nr:ABC transporter permease [Alloacidobacterium dinghuense]QNI31223.1 ABC transporter permease [Alloacidobacterium dinghuense]
MPTFLLDLKFAFRQLRKSPGFAATAVLMLAFGIGATTAIFSIVEGVLLRPLPFPDPDRLVVLADRLQGADVGGNGEAGVTVPDIRAYTRDTHSFTALGGYQFAGYELSGNGDPAQVNAARLTGGVFPALGVAPLLGRVYTQQEDDDHQQVVVLSYSTWQSRFHGDPKILGTKILLDRKPYLVIGVMPRNFEFPLTSGHLNRIELWAPMSFRPDELSPTAGANWSYQMVGRLKPGVSTTQAQQDAERVAQDIMRGYPSFMASLHITSVVRPLQEETIEGARPLVRTLFFAVAIVLLIACANLAGLLLVRAIRRQREVAVRMALGARSSALLRQAILESLILSVTGGVLGVVLAGAALTLGKNLLPESLPRISEIGLNWIVVGFALLLAVATGFVCGLAPAFAALRTSVNETLKEGGRSGSAGGGHARLRSALVVAEIAIALILLTASGLLLRSFEKMRSVDLGFQPEHIATAAYSLPQKQYATQASIDTFNKELLLRLRQAPGGQAVGLTSFLPASGNNNNQAFVPEGYVPPKGENMSLATNAIVMGDYFSAMKIPLLRGRYLTEADNADAQLVLVVNRKLAEHYWPNQDPIGKRIRIGTPEMQTPWLTIVGEIADVKLGAPDEPTKEQYYLTVDQIEKAFGTLANPATDLNGNGGYIVLRSALPPEQMENVLRATARSIDPQLALTQVQTMVQNVSDTEAPRRFNTALISAFAAAAVLLAVLGIYSVIAFSVASRVHEMAIRMALGSQRGGIMRLILISGTKLAAVGCAIGLIGGAAAAGLLRSFLFGVSPFDPVVLTMAAVAVLLLALAASALPAMRAASIDPMQSLRGE